MELLCQYQPCGTRKARIITSLLYEQLAKDLLLYCDPQKTPKAYRAASLLDRVRKGTSYSISELTWIEDRLKSPPRLSHSQSTKR